MELRYIYFFFVFLLGNVVWAPKIVSAQPQKKGIGNLYRHNQIVPIIFAHKLQKRLPPPPVALVTTTLKRYISTLFSHDNGTLVQEFFWSLLENAAEKTATLPSFFRDTCVDFVAYRLALGIFYIIHRSFTLA